MGGAFIKSLSKSLAGIRVGRRSGGARDKGGRYASNGWMGLSIHHPGPGLLLKR